MAVIDKNKQMQHIGGEDMHYLKVLCVSVTLRQKEIITMERPLLCC